MPFAINELNIYFAETTKTEFANKSEWTPESELTLVYSGENVVVGDDAWEIFQFDTPYEYSGEKNLAVMISKSSTSFVEVLKLTCCDAAKSIMFTASDTDSSFAKYPTADGMSVYSKKPVMKLITPATKLDAPTNLRAYIRQDIPDYNYKYEITMAWDAVEGAQGYDVFVNTTKEQDFYLGYTGGTAYVAGSNEETTFEFYIVAFNDDLGLESEPSEICTVTVVDDAIEEMNASFNIYPNPVNDKIYIEILDWIVPDHRPRIEAFYLGAMEVYTKSNLVKYSHTQSADLLSTELPKNQIVFSLDNSSDVWNPDNPVGNVRYLMDRQEISVRYGYKLPMGVEWIPAGTFWISEWNTPANGLEATFTARDILEFLDITYSGPKAGTLYDIAIAALSQADLPTTASGGPRYEVDESLKTISTDFSDDSSSYTAAVVLQMVANAGQCIMRQTRDGMLRIKRFVRSLSDYVIGQNVSYAHPERVMTKPPKHVNVNDDMWIENLAPTGEPITIKNPLISQTDNAENVARWASTVLRHRNIVKGSYRSDPSLDVLDVVSIESKYSKNFVTAITEITYEYKGAFRGQYTGREIEV